MKILSALLLILLAVALSFSQSPILDDFNRADGALGANWTSTGDASVCTVASNVMSCGVASGGRMHIYTGTSFSPDQFSTVTVVNNPAANHYVGPIVRGSSSASTNYRMEIGSDNKLYISRLVAGTNTALVNVTFTRGTSQVLTLTAEGSNPVILKGYVNGTKAINYSDSDGTRITSGYAGITAYTSTATVTLDNFFAGNMSVQKRTVIQ